MPLFFVFLFIQYLLAATVTGQRRERKEKSHDQR
jgi:hypothetical protein